MTSLLRIGLVMGALLACLACGPSHPSEGAPCVVGSSGGFLDACGACVGGETGREACAEDCQGEPGGSAFLDVCGRCVEGSTGSVPCEPDCEGVAGGSAFLDLCGTCVGGETGREACEADCHGEPGGSAFVDACGVCVGGATGEEACTEDCSGQPGGTAVIDPCGACVGGNTGKEACRVDCNGDVEGSASLDACGVCVGGETGRTPCVADCNGDYGGGAVIDGCGACVGGETGRPVCPDACGPDRHGERGARYLSLVTFQREHPGNYKMESTGASMFGVVSRAQGYLSWLYLYREIGFEPGLWAIDARMAVTGENWARVELKASPRGGAGCGLAASSEWLVPPQGKDAWQVTPSPVQVRTHRACTVEVSLLDSLPTEKAGWGFDWIRIRRACTTDAQCPTVEGGPFGSCVSGICSYEAVCPAGSP